MNLLQTRKRDCLKAGKIVDAKNCKGDKSEKERCGYFPCPGEGNSSLISRSFVPKVVAFTVECKWGGWRWGTNCNKQCGNGTRIETRVIDQRRVLL